MSALSEPWWQVFGALVVVCAGLKFVEWRKGSKDGGLEKLPPGARSLQWRYLCVHWLVKLADWLQGPYFYEVYATKLDGQGNPLSHRVISSLFVTGFGSSLVFGTFAGSLSDSLGRKRAALACCGLSILACISVHADSLPLLFAGRLAGGIASSLLHSSFEAWYCTAAEAVPFSKKEGRQSWISRVLTLQTFGDGLSAVLAGVVANKVYDAMGGPVAVFETSLITSVGASIGCLVLWTENYGQGAGPETSTAQNVKRAFSVLTTDRPVLLLGLAQSLFEASMFTFVLQWVVTLRESAQHTAELAGSEAMSLPLGIIFASFMVCIMIGSTSFGLLLGASASISQIVLGLLVVSSACFITPFVSYHVVPVAAAWLLFETCCGLSFPGFGCLRSEIVPQSCRGTIMTFYRVPLNLLVMATTLNAESLGPKLCMGICAGMVLVAAALMAVLRSVRARGPATVPGKKDE